MAKIGVIGGSGLYEIEGIKDLQEQEVQTPFGHPSDRYMTGRLEETEVVFLPRHGQGHKLTPSEVNYRANIFGMKVLGVEAIFSVSAVGSLKEDLKPMDFVIPDQFLDRTKGIRNCSFYGDGIVVHIPFADPVSKELCDILEDACKQAKVTVHRDGTYVNMEGPQFSTKAESHLYRSWGMDIIGMTNLTEAKLAREAEISYATLAAVTDYDCWHESHESVSVDMIIEYLMKNVSNAKRILKIAVPAAGKLETFSALGSLEHAILTRPEAIPDRLRSDLSVLIGKYIK